MNRGMDECMYRWIDERRRRMLRWWVFSKGCPYAGFLVVIGCAASHHCRSRSMREGEAARDLDHGWQMTTAHSELEWGEAHESGNVKDQSMK